MTRKPKPRSRWKTIAVVGAVVVTTSIYLFATAPPPLAATTPPPDTIPIRAVFSMLELENDAARALYSDEIVNRGKGVGLVFDERWRAESVHAGPLPALFLRETARHLERSGTQLGLFLGSRFPINPANRLSGDQAERFAVLEAMNAPQFFYEINTGRQTAMFADRAVAEVCVRCHNEHADSPKKDWQANAVMGATTWMYPDPSVTRERALELIAALREGIRAAYTAYLGEVSTFRERPEVGTRWPRDGFYLPTVDAFMAELARRTSATTLAGLIDPASAERAAASDPVPSQPPPPPLQPAPADPYANEVTLAGPREKS